jgi:hypothetical protein
MARIADIIRPDMTIETAHQTRAAATPVVRPARIALT